MTERETKADFDAAWLLERVGMDVERLMRAEELTRAGLAERLREAGCSIGREWIGELIEGRLKPDAVELADLVAVFYALRKRAHFKFERRA